MEPSRLDMEKMKIAVVFWSGLMRTASNVPVQVTGCFSTANVKAVGSTNPPRLNSCCLAELGQFETWPRRIPGSRYRFGEAMKLRSCSRRFPKWFPYFERKVALHRNPIHSIRCWRTVLVRRKVWKREGQGRPISSQLGPTGATCAVEIEQCLDSTSLKRTLAGSLTELDICLNNWRVAVAQDTKECSLPSFYTYIDDSHQAS